MLTQSISRRIAPSVHNLLSFGSDRDRAQNPSLAGGLLIGAGIAAAVVGVGWLVRREMQIPTPVTPIPVPQDPNESLADYFLMGATLNDAPSVVDDVQGPISLARIGDDVYMRAPDLAMIRPNTDQPVDLQRAIFGYQDNPNRILFTAVGGSESQAVFPGPTIGYVVTNMTGEFTAAAYEWALAFIADNDSSWDSDEMRDATIAKILVRIAPELDWSQGLQPYTADSLAYTAWIATYTIGQIAYQTLVNKQ